MADISKIKLPNNSEYNFRDPISYNKIVSRGEQLVVNGSGLLGDNTNFTNWTFDGSMANGSSGSFTRTSTIYANIGTDEYFPVKPTAKYLVSLDMVSSNGLATAYLYLSMYDADKHQISTSDRMWRPNTLTTLSQELKNGDTVVHLTDLSNWDVNTSTRTYQRGFIFWNYTNSFGYVYPENTYSKNHWSDLYTDANVNKTANTITLNTAWSKGTIPAGTKVSQSDSGSTYMYLAIRGSVVPTSWRTYSQYISGIDNSGGQEGGKFWAGTAYAKVGFLWNYNSANDQLWAANVSIKEIAPNNEYMKYLGVQTSIGSATPASGVKTFWADNVPQNEVVSLYNNSGSEYALLASKSTNYGTVLKWGYADRYIRILRKASSWQSDDWEKISSGYADSAGSAENVTGTVAIANGGTGTTTAAGAANNLITSLPDWTADPTDTTKLIRRDTGGTASFGQVTFSTVWNYIKGKISSILGLTATNYGGTSAKATADASGNTITSTYSTKAETVTAVTHDTTNHKITKTINGSTTDVIGAASTSGYGITKLNSATNSTSTTEAATPSAVKTAKDRADEAYSKAATVESGLNGTLIYDHTYTISNGVATFTPHVYLKGQEVTTDYAVSCFTWKYKLANNVTGTPSYVNLTTNNDRTCTVTISTLGYGGYVLGEFTPA